ncbi:hypothetical protein [Spirosoma aerolatum]|nr:hypothetical protein [Spirosoma aerolatum]
MQRYESEQFGDTRKTIALPSGQVLANVDEFYRRDGSFVITPKQGSVS